VSMIDKYTGGVIPEPGEAAPVDDDLRQTARAVVADVEREMDQMHFSTALQRIWDLVGRTNKYIDETMPWVLAKDEARRGRLHTVLYNLAESIRIVSVLLQPFLTKTPPKIWRQLGIAEQAEVLTWESTYEWGRLPVGARVMKGEPLFPRLDIKAEIAVIDASTAEARRRAEENRRKLEAAKAGTAGGPEVGSGYAAPGAAGTGSASADAAGAAEVTVEQFFQTDLRVAEVKAAERVPKTDKLLKLILDVGGETRQVLSGIAQRYAPEELVGKKVVLVANLKPAKIRGEWSQGMILAADGPDGPHVLFVDAAVPNGAKVK